MIDGLKILRLPVNREFILNNPVIEPVITTNTITGEIDHTQKPPIAKHQGFAITFYPTRVELSGSIHKFYNGGEHNHNDFGINELIIAVTRLCNTFGIDPDSAVLNGLEIGVNIELPYSPRLFLNSLIMHKGEPFTDQKHWNKHYRECSHIQYYIKVYDKGKQYGLGRFVLRIEIKFIKMETLSKLGIRTLADLTEQANFVTLGGLLLQTFEDILAGNLTADASHLNSKDRELFIAGHNPAFWDQHLPTSKNFKQGNSDPEYKKQYKRYDAKLRRFKTLLKTTGAHKLKDEIRELVVQKIDFLSTLRGQGELDQQQQTELRGNLTDNTNMNKGELDPLLYSVISPLSGKNNAEGETSFCVITGANISMQKKGSRFLSTIGLTLLKDNDPEKFNELLRHFLPRSGVSGLHTAHERDDISHLAKQIRNAHHNSRRYYVRVPEGQLELFQP